MIFTSIVVEFGCYQRPERRRDTDRESQSTKSETVQPARHGHVLEERDANKKKGLFLVTKVVDGDTFWVDNGTEIGLKVRFIGIDAPEVKNVGRKKKGYYGKEAKDFVTKLTEGKWVKLEYDIRRTDQYHRTLAYVYLEDGTLLNAHLVENGYAVVDTHPPNIKYVELFVKLQQEARDNGRGLWSSHF